ncbi:MAG TPA: bifunctional phosphoglucose/phosphomannose isomerase [Candidatus Saccharimonadales bacterium]|nr:bifunctional phosphoglucose/phosphomannose isomerase [Candidatus Saccharimonadales bacterium]
MLDDLKFIHFRDGSDALGIAERQASQLDHEFGALKLKGGYKNVVHAGMGGSALPALVAQVWPSAQVPFEVSRQYHAPSYVGPDTLFIACSYSGNTEETLNALTEAEGQGAEIVILSGGGKLHEIARQKGYPFLLIPKAEQPRYAVFYMLAAIVKIFESAGLADPEAADELKRAAPFVAEAVKAWLPTVPLANNPAKKLAQELAGKSAIIYGGPLMAAAAYKWKISFNENAKNVAWWNELPEFDHNELIGWTSHPIEKPYGVVEIRSSLEHPRVLKRFEVAERLLSGRRPAPHVVEPEGDSLLQQLLWAIAYGDFVTLYVALLNNQNPSPVDLVEKFKKALDE